MPGARTGSLLLAPGSDALPLDDEVPTHGESKTQNEDTHGQPDAHGRTLLISPCHQVEYASAANQGAEQKDTKPARDYPDALPMPEEATGSISDLRSDHWNEPCGDVNQHAKQHEAKKGRDQHLAQHSPHDDLRPNEERRQSDLCPVPGAQADSTRTGAAHVRCIPRRTGRKTSAIAALGKSTTGDERLWARVSSNIRVRSGSPRLERGTERSSRYTPAMSEDSVAPVPGGSALTLDVERASSTRRLALTGGVVALLALAVAMMTLVVYAIDDHQTPGVVASADRIIAVACAVAAAIAVGASIGGYLLRQRPVWGRALAMLGLTLAVCPAVLLGLMWV